MKQLLLIILVFVSCSNVEAQIYPDTVLYAEGGECLANDPNLQEFNLDLINDTLFFFGRIITHCCGSHYFILDINHDTISVSRFDTNQCDCMCLLDFSIIITSCPLDTYKFILSQMNWAPGIDTILSKGHLYLETGLMAYAGNDTAFCASDIEMLKLGGNPTAKGGIPPYSYSWSAELKISGHIFNASTFLNDTSVANPSFREYVDSLMFYLEVTDSIGVKAFDSTYVRFSRYIFCTGECREYINEGDSVKLYHFVFGGIPPFSYSWTPEETLSDPHSATPWAKPLVNTTYNLHVTDSIGCMTGSTCKIFVTPAGVPVNQSPKYYVRIIPDFAKDILTLTTNHPHLNNSSFEIINIEGKTLRIWTVNERTSVFNCNGLGQGVYLYRFRLNDVCIERGKFVYK